MASPIEQIVTAPVDTPVVRIALAAALGLFLGLEREWSHKSAGIRTFSLISLLAAVFIVLGETTLLVVGGVLVIVLGALLGVEGLHSESEAGLSLTTSVSMLVTYGVGALVASGRIIEGVTVAVLSSLLLVLKRELHRFAWGLSHIELRSTTEFAILAFVIYPLLPATPIELGTADVSVAVEPRVVWFMVVFVAGIGIVNYAAVNVYGGRGVAVTGFFGGLASSTAVVGTMLDYVDRRPESVQFAVAAVMLADAAMALRNLLIAIVFTLTAAPLAGAAIPLGIVIVGSVAIAWWSADWSEAVTMEIESPFSLRNALAFGLLFLLVVLAGGLAQAWFGTTGFYLTVALTGLVSSAGATTTAVALYRTGSLTPEVAVVAILLATASSVVVKAILTAAGSDREFALRVGGWSLLLLVAAGLAVLVTGM